MTLLQRYLEIVILKELYEWTVAPKAFLVMPATNLDAAMMLMISPATTDLMVRLALVS